MKTSSRLKGVGDPLFKIWVIGILVGSMARYAAVFRYLPEMKIVLPLWILALLSVVICVEFVLLIIPLCVGLFIRRSWGRKLWLVVLLLELLRPLDTYWQYGPFAPGNSMAALLGRLTGTGICIAVCLSRPFIRYMNRQGGRVWFRIALITCILGAVAARGVAAWWLCTIPKNTTEQVSWPADSIRNPMPVGWREAEAYGYIIPVPVSSTNDHHVFEDGNEWHNFMERRGEEILRYALIAQETPNYHYFPENTGIVDLEKAYRIRYDNSFLMLAGLMRMLESEFSHVGFCSREEMDMMFRFRSVNDGLSFIEVELENGKDYHKLIIFSKMPLTLEEKFRLVASVRPSSEATVSTPKEE
ncbi:MAG: hypothetical protein HKP10_09340 [Kiritimatiellales bacterium]|nr:hypothetical protein [Kiritimatiellales bacterium]